MFPFPFCCYNWHIRQDWCYLRYLRVSFGRNGWNPPTTLSSAEIQCLEKCQVSISCLFHGFPCLTLAYSTPGVLLGLGYLLFIFLGASLTSHGSQALFSVCPISAISMKVFSNFLACTWHPSLFLCEFRFSIISTLAQTFYLELQRAK